jgi:hypothetical protein
MSRLTKYSMAMALLALSVSLASCGKAEKAAEKTTDQSAQGTQSGPRTFKSPEEAGATLFAAAKSGDQAEVLAIFGSEAKDLLLSGDPVQDKNNRENFVASYSKMNRWSKDKAGQEILYVGADNFAFPIPLQQNKDGQWSFNIAAGKDEVLARRIGNNELVAMNVLGDIAGAQELYFTQAHGGAKQYAQKFVSDPGQQNGLYWDAAEGQPASPLGPIGDFAKTLGYTGSDKTQPFQGYHYRMLTKQGAKAKGGARDYMADGKLASGFAAVAWPADYGNSGIMTFMVGKDGVVFQKDLGEKTAETAAAITEFNPEGWEVVLEPVPTKGPGTKAAKK